MDKKKILLIDDEKDFCLLVGDHLEAIGDFEVYAATDGKKGISISKKVKPDLIILDILMPGIDGFKVLEELKKDAQLISVPVIMLSGKDDDLSKLKAAQLYDELYITKPVDTHTLKDKIEEVLKKRGVIH